MERSRRTGRSFGLRLTLLAPRLKTATHCPYCSLQCGMDLARDDRRATVADARGGGLCSKGWTSAELLDHPERLTDAAGPRPSAERRCARRAGTRRSTGSRASRDSRADATAATRSGLRRRRADQREGLPARQVRPGRAAHRAIDYNGRFCMSSAAAAGNRAFGLDRGLPFPLADIADAPTCRAGRRQPGRHDAAGACSTSTTGRAGGARHVVVDPRAHRRPPARAALHLQPLPGTDLALANGLLHIALAEGLVDEEYVAARTTGFDAVRRSASARTGRTGSSGSPACRWPTCGAPSRAAGRRRRAAMILTARGAEQHAPGHRHRAGVDQPGARARAARPAGLRLRQPHRPGQRAGRPRARAEGRPAARLPRASTTRPPGRTSPASGASTPTTCPARAVRVRAARRARHRRRRARAAGARAPTSRSPRRTRAGCSERLDALDFLAVSDFFLSETAELADVVLPSRPVGGGGGHDDQPRGPGDPAPRRALDPPAGRPRRPARCSPGSPTGWAPGQPSRERPRDGLRGAAPGQRRRRRRLRRHQLRADRRTSGACSGPARTRTTPARRGCSPTGSPPPTAGPGSSGSSTASRRRAARRRVPLRR